MTQIDPNENIELQKEYNARFEEELYAKGEETAGIAKNIGVMNQLIAVQASALEKRMQDSYAATLSARQELENLSNRFRSALDENMEREAFSSLVSSYGVLFSKRNIVRQIIHGHGQGINAFVQLSRLDIDHWLRHAFLGLKEEAHLGKALVSEEAKTSLFYALYYHEACKDEPAGKWLERYFKSCDINDFIVPCDDVLRIPFDVECARLLDEDEVKERFLQYLEQMSHAEEHDYPALSEHCLQYDVIMNGLRQMEKISFLSELEYEESPEGGYMEFLDRRDRDEDKLLHSLHESLGIDMRETVETYEDYIIDGLSRLRPFPCLVYGEEMMEAVDEFIARNEAPEGVVVKCHDVNVMLVGEDIDLSGIDERYGKLTVKEMLMHPLFWMYAVFIVMFALYAPRENWGMVYASVFGIACSVFGVFTLRSDMAEGNGKLLEEARQIAQICGEEYQKWQYAYESARLGREELGKKVNRHERD